MAEKSRCYAPFLVLDFRLDIVDRIRGFDFKSDSFAREGPSRNYKFFARQMRGKDALYEDLHLARSGRFGLSNEVNDGVFDKSKSRLCGKDEISFFARLIVSCNSNSA
jgi:hypothetical protein